MPVNNSALNTRVNDILSEIRSERGRDLVVHIIKPKDPLEASMRLLLVEDAVLG